MRKKVLFFILLIGLLADGACKKKDAPSHLGVGEPMPAFSTYLIGGQNICNDDLAGGVSLIVFFDTRCYDCREELPEIESLSREFGGNVSFLAISRGNSKDDVESYWRMNGFALPVSAPETNSVFDLFDGGSFSGVPQIYLFGADGLLASAYCDGAFVPRETLLADISRLLP